MSGHNEMITRVRRNLLQDLRESPQEKKFLKLPHENFEESVADCSPAGVRTFDFHESGRREYRSCVLSVSSVSSVERIPATLVTEVDELYLDCDNPSRTLSSAMKNLRLCSEQRKRGSASPSEEKSSSLERNDRCDNQISRVSSAVETSREEEIKAATKKWSCATTVKKSKMPADEDGAKDALKILGCQEPGVPFERGSERNDRRENLGVQNGRVASAVETSREEEIRAATKKWSCATTVKKSKMPADEKGPEVAEDIDTAKRERLPARDRARRRSSKCRRRSGQFVSMAEAIRKFHTTTPSRYRTYPRTTVVRRLGKLPNASTRSPSCSISAKGSNNSKNEAGSRGAKKAAISISPSANRGKPLDGSRLGLPKARNTSSTRGVLSSAMRSRRELVAKPEAAPSTGTRVQVPCSDHKLGLPGDSACRLDPRHTSDGSIRQKENEPKALRLAAEREQQEFRNRELRQLRRTMEIRAKPMPRFKPPVIAKSSKPLTEPHSPAWSRRK